MADAPASSPGAQLTDPARLQALRRSALLDAPPDEALARFTRLARRLLQTPVALVSLVDDRRQFFAAQDGLEGWAADDRETPLSHSFCQHVVADGAPLRVDDARDDARLRDNRAIPDLGVLSYLGLPIHDAAGYVLGSFCVLGSTPRAWTDDEEAVLTDLRDALETELALRDERVQRAALAQTAAAAAQDHDRVLASISDALFSLDRDWRFTYLNDRAEDVLERSREAVLGRSLWDEFPDAVGGPFWETYHDAVRTGEPTHLEAFSDRLGRHLAIRAYPTDGGLTVYFTDVTEQKETEAALRDNEARYRTLIESIDEGFCIVEMLYDAAGTLVDYRFLETNPAFEAQSGIEGAVGRTMREIAPEMEAHWFETYDRVVRTGEPVRLEGAAEALGRWFDVYAARIGGPESRRLAILFTDVTERRAAEAALRASEARARLALDAARLGLWSWDPATDAGTQDARAQEIFGLAPDEQITMAEAFERVLHPDDLPEVQAALGAALDPDGDGRLSLELRIPRADGPPAWVRTTAQAAFDGEGAGRRAVHMVGTVQDITPAKTAEAALRGSEARYRFLGETLRQQIWTAWPDGQLDYVNRYVLDYFGRTEAEMVGEGWADVVHPDDLPDVAERWAHALATGETYEVEFRLLRAEDQTYRWHIGRADALRDAAGRIERWFGANTDIHERKSTAELLEAREAELHTLANSIPQLAWIADATGAITWYNQRWYDYTGTTPDAMLGWGWKAVHDPELVDGIAERFAASVAEGQPWEDTFPLRGADGVFRWFLSRAQPLRDARGRVVRWFGTNTDVTEQRQLLAARDEALERLVQSQARHRLALEGGRMGTWEWDITTDHLNGDERVYDLWGTRPGAVESVAAFYERLVHPDDLPNLQATVAEALAEGDDYAYDFRIVRPDGRVRWLANRGRVVRDADGTPRRMFGLSFDVTDRREAEQELLLKNREMEQFTYTISHDLKSPLVTITGFLGLMKGHVQAGRTDKAMAAADRVLGAADRMGRLIEDLLQLSRAGRVLGTVRPVDLGALTADLAGALRARARASGGTIVVEDGLGCLLTDEARISEVLENLLANAITYGLGQGGTQVTVRRETAPDGTARVVVEDDGPGVPAAYRTKVFDLFQRLDADSEGTGIGLALVARILQVMGGNAHVEDADGPPERPGARFVLSFPPDALCPEDGDGNASASRRVDGAPSP